MRILVLLIFLTTASAVPAVEVAPRISDKEIDERLTRLEEDQKALDERVDDLRSEMNGRFDDLRSEMNARFDTLQWMIGPYVTIWLVILGFTLRMQWQMHRRLVKVGTALETQKDELAFLKGLIEKLLHGKEIL